MKNRLVLFVLCLSVAGLFYFFGNPSQIFIGSKDEASHTSTVTKADSPSSRDIERSPIPPEPLTTPQARTYYPSLDLDEQTLKQLDERFSKPYNANFPADHDDKRDTYDVAERIGLLKKLHLEAQKASIPEQQRFLGLYKKILMSPDEHWLVKRQTLRNAAPLWSFLKEKERDQILSKVDLRARELWRKSERELALEIVAKIERSSPRQPNAVTIKEGATIPLPDTVFQEVPLHELIQNPPTYGSVNLYENLPCPSSEDAHRLVAKINLNAGDRAISCSDEFTGKILKLAHLAERMKIYPPKNWGGIHREVYASLLDYVVKMIPLIEIDIHNQNKIAANFLKTKISLGSQFFDLPPLGALEVLVHEARHSSFDDPGHTRCRTGDIAKTSAACDEEFSIKKTAGSYSYGFMYHLGLGQFGENLSSEDRDFLINSAIAGITSRFNQVPETLAVPLDMLFVLKENNQLFQVHPFTKELLPVEVEPLLKGQNITRIQYSPLGQGILIFTDQGKVLALDQNKKQIDYYSDLLPPDFTAVDSTKIYLSTGPAGEYAYTMFLNKDGDLFLKDVDLHTGKVILAAYKNRPPVMTKKLFMGSTFGAFLLSEAGTIYQIQSNPRGKDPQNYVLYSSFAASGMTWVDATGGATYDGLQAIGSDGKLYFEKFTDNGGNPIQRSDFLSATKLQKYQEGLNIKAALTSTGKILVWDYARSQKTPWLLPMDDIKDFALGRSYAPADFLLPRSAQNSQWSQTCGTDLTYVDPWTKGFMGLKDDGVLIFSGAESACVDFKGQKDFVPENLEIAGSELYEDFNHFSQAYLQLKDTDNEVMKLHPYYIAPPPIDKYVSPPYRTGSLKE